MGNWFSVEAQSGAVVISSEFTMSDKSELTGARGILNKKEKIGQIGNLEIIRSVPEETIAEKTTGFETVPAIAMLLAITIMKLNKNKIDMNDEA